MKCWKGRGHARMIQPKKPKKVNLINLISLIMLKKKRRGSGKVKFRYETLKKRQKPRSLRPARTRASLLVVRRRHKGLFDEGNQQRQNPVGERGA